MALYLNGKKVFGGIPLAEEVIYDNTDSGLTAENAQDAVDELASEKADKSAISNLITLSGKSGSIASFSTDISDKLFSCYVNVVAQQAGSGTPAPDNVRSISGWSGCNLVGCQKNILDYEAWKSSTPMASRCTYVFQNNGISVTATAGDGYCRPSYEIPVRSGEQITLSWSSETNILGTVYVFFSDSNFINVYSSAQKLTTTIPDDCSKIRIRFGVANTGNTINYANLQIEYNDTSTTYEAYNGTTHNIPFNTTVYGGVLDVLSGVLTVTHGSQNLGDLTWTYNSSVQQFRASLAQCKPPVTGAYTTGLLCSIYKEVPHFDLANENYAISRFFASVDSINVKDSRYTDADVYKTAMNGIYLYYPLKTPTTIQLTPTEVKTILGQNNIFADCGDIDLKYLETIGNRL